MTVLAQMAIVMITCGNESAIGTRFSDLGDIVSTASAFKKSKLANCTAFDGKDRTAVLVQKVLLTSFLSFDHMIFRDVPGKSAKIRPSLFLRRTEPQVGTEVVTYLPASPAKKESKPRSVAASITDCAEAKHGLARARALPKDESDTHPDQVFGYTLWARFCDFFPFGPETSPAGETVTFAGKKWVEVTTKVLGTSAGAAFAEVPGAVEGMPVLYKDKAMRTMMGFVTNSRPFSTDFLLKNKGPAVIRNWNNTSPNELEAAISKGLWDY